ncbi:MAG: peptidase domain-containing ABC transporter [Bacteroidales bacterium]|nr:peptidase domain-containing ABC transporter [Bacteroidales bacterium]
MSKKKFPFYQQHDSMDCGPACLRMIAKYHGRTWTLETLREKSYLTREGVSLMGISDAAESIGFHTTGVKLSWDQLLEEAKLPVIIHWNQNHFIVLYKISRNRAFVADPAHGLLQFSKEEFLSHWISDVENQQPVGVALLLEPTPRFYYEEGEVQRKRGFSFLMPYLKPHKKLITQLFLGLLLGSVLQLIFPFLTQAIVDIGIGNQNISFIYLILIAQLVLFISRLSVDFIRSWILLFITTRVNVTVLSDFLAKLMRLPISFFDTKMTGDIIQRIGDHKRIENFLTGQTIVTLFSLFNLVIFGIVLLIYDWRIFLVFIIGSLIYVWWILLFLKKRKNLDHKQFAKLSENQSTTIQLITGMQEIKLQNSEKLKRWEWEKIQAALYKISMKGLSISQYQQSGSLLINESKNIIITVIAATSVVNGYMTLGMMLAVQYIIGQLNAPLMQLVEFVHVAQDAKISLERLEEIHQRDDEEHADESRLNYYPAKKDINIKDVSFQYEGPHSEEVLKNMSVHIPEGRVTAIVGTSGSGKTTLIKLLLGFYRPVNGSIEIGNTSLEHYNSRWWREQCGAVMQDGFIFSDTIARNIAVSDEKTDKQRLIHAVNIANIDDFIEGLPMAYNTKIGQDGIGLSQGQKQRILIARAVYKNPQYLFFDEATNALDANNEKVIMEHLNSFFIGRTVIIVAHRLSTVRNADQIIVLNKGVLVEHGTHETLTQLKGEYYQLVKNQLELGS